MNQSWESPFVNIYTRKNYGYWYNGNDTSSGQQAAHFFLNYELVSSCKNIISLIFRQDIEDISYLELTVPYTSQLDNVQPLDIVCVNCTMDDFKQEGYAPSWINMSVREQMIITRVEKRSSIVNQNRIVFTARSLKWLYQGKLVTNDNRNNAIVLQNYSTLSVWNAIRMQTVSGRYSATHPDVGDEFGINVDSPSGFTSDGQWIYDSSIAQKYRDQIMNESTVNVRVRDDFGKSYYDYDNELLSGTDFFWRLRISLISNDLQTNIPWLRMIISGYRDTNLKFSFQNKRVSESSYVYDITNYFNSCLTMTNEPDTWKRKNEWYDQKYTDSLVDKDKMANPSSSEQFVDGYKQRHICSTNTINAKKEDGSYYELYGSGNLYPAIFENGRQECAKYRQINEMSATIQPYDLKYLKDFYIGDKITVTDYYGNEMKAVISQVEETWQQNEGYMINLTVTTQYLNGEYASQS